MATTVNNTVIIVQFPLCCQVWRLGPLVGGSSFALFFRKKLVHLRDFYSIHLRAYFSQANVTIALIVFY